MFILDGIVQGLIRVVADGNNHCIRRYLLNGLMHALQTHDQCLAVDVRHVGCCGLYGGFTVFIGENHGVLHDIHLVVVHEVNQAVVVGSGKSFNVQNRRHGFHQCYFLILSGQIICQFASGQAGTDDQNILVLDILVVQHIDRIAYIRGIKARCIQSSFLRTRCHKDFIIACSVGSREFGIQLNIDTGVFHLFPVPCQQSSVIFLKVERSRRDEDTAELTGLFIQIHFMTAQRSRTGSFHTGNTAADHGNLLLCFSRDYVVMILHTAARVQRTADILGRKLLVINLEDTCQTSEMTGNARSDIGFLSIPELVAEIGIGEQRSAHAHHVNTSVRNGFISQLRVIKPAAADHRNMNVFADLCHIVQVQCLRHIHRRMRPVPGIIRTVVAVQHVIAGFLQDLCDADAFVDVTAEFLKRFARHGTLVEALGIALDGIPYGYREVISAFLLDGFDNLNREAQTVLQTAAVFILAVVVIGNGELVEQIPFMHGMDLDTVDTRIPGGFGSERKPVNIVFNLLFGHLTVIMGGIPDIRQSGRCRVIPVCAASSGKCGDHDEYLGTVLMNTVGEILLILHVGFQVVHDGRQMSSRRQRYKSGDDKACSSLCTFNVVICAVLGIASVRIHQTRTENTHRQKRNAVGDFHLTDFHR